MGQVSFICSRCFEFWMLSKLQDASKEILDKNTSEARIIKIVVDPKNSTPIMVWFVGRV